MAPLAATAEFVPDNVILTVCVVWRMIAYWRTERLLISSAQ